MLLKTSLHKEKDDTNSDDTNSDVILQCSDAWQIVYFVIDCDSYHIMGLRVGWGGVFKSPVYFRIIILLYRHITHIRVTTWRIKMVGSWGVFDWITEGIHFVVLQLLYFMS